MKFTSYNSHPSTRRPNEYTTWLRSAERQGVCMVGNSGWIETAEAVPNGTVLELNNVRFQPESFTGKLGEQLTMNHIVAQ